MARRYNQPPGYYDVKRGDISDANFEGSYEIPLAKFDNFEQLVDTDIKSRQKQIEDAEKNYESLNKVKAAKTIDFGSPELNQRYQELLTKHQLDDKSHKAALNGNPYLMRKMQMDYATMANTSQFRDLMMEKTQAEQFEKEALKIKDPYMKKMALASVYAYKTGGSDPVLNKKVKASDLNLADYVPMDIEKSFTDGFGKMISYKEEIRDQDGYKVQVKVPVVDPAAAQKYAEAYSNSPAVQRNMIARGLGEMVPDETGVSKFHLNEYGQNMFKLMMDSKLKGEDIQALRYNTKTYNEMQTNVSTGMITDDIAKMSITSSDGIDREGGLNVVRRNNQFNDKVFDTNFELRMINPEFKAKAKEQGLIDENGNKTTIYDQVKETYKNTLSNSKIVNSKNIPSASKGRSGGSSSKNQALSNVMEAYESKGLKFIKVPAGMAVTNVDYKVMESNGKYYLNKGTGENLIPLEEGKDYTKTGSKVSAPTKAQVLDPFEIQKKPQGSGAQNKSKKTLYNIINAESNTK